MRQVTFDHSHDHNDQRPAKPSEYRLWAHVLVYPGGDPRTCYLGDCGPDRAMNGVFRHRCGGPNRPPFTAALCRKIQQQPLLKICAHPVYQECTNYSYQSYGWQQPNSSSTGARLACCRAELIAGCVGSGQPEPHSLYCPYNASLDMQFCVQTEHDKDKKLYVDTWLLINGSKVARLQTGTKLLSGGQVEFLKKSKLLNAISGEHVLCD